MESLDGHQRDSLSSSVSSSSHTDSDEETHGQPDPIRDAALLGLGLLLEGSSLFMRNSGLSSGDGASSRETVPATAQQVARRTLIGLIAEGRNRVQARQAAVRRARSEWVDRVSSVTAPLTHWFPVDVTLTIVEIFAGYSRWKVESTVNRWAEHGAVEEERARALAQRAFDGWIDEALAYFARNPAVRELVTQQGEEVAAGALDDLRMRAQSADTWLAQITRRALQRATRTHMPVAAEPSSSPPTAASESSG